MVSNVPKNIVNCGRMVKVNYVRYSITLILFIGVMIKVSTANGYTNFACKQVGPCRCKRPDGDLIDLSPLENFTSLEPVFLSTSSNQSVYYYHPCSDHPLPTSQTTECSSVYALCFFKADDISNGNLDAKAVLSGGLQGKFHLLALSVQATFQVFGSEIHLTYKTQNVTTVITLDCDESSNAKSILSLKDPGATINLSNHNLVLHSPYSCFRRVNRDKHISGFGIFCLILITIASVYFFGGMLVLRHIKGATGTEMIPNYEFWVSLLSSIKNCFMALIGRESQITYSYERI